MSPGLYIHIPFCRRKCIYCAFYSVASFGAGQPEAYRAALLREAGYFHAHYFGSLPIRPGTLYIGGGTPSLLPVSFYASLYESLARYMDFSSLSEVTMEANPEHLTYGYLQDLYRYTPVRRLSIGVQSFADSDLRMLNRCHSGQEAIRAVENAHKAGFSELSVDLIYGLQPDDSRNWQENLRLLGSLDLPHFSAYALTVEPRTLLEVKLRKNRIRIAGEERMEKEYFQLQDFAQEKGYEAYEISNYARAGHYAVHNRNYWRNVPYIGLGAAAHSYIGRERHWNVSRVETYTADPVSTKEREYLSETDSYHEYVMTALRTVWGVEKRELERFSPELRQAFYRQAEQEIEKGNLLGTDESYIVPAARRLLTDGIAAAFF